MFGSGVLLEVHLFGTSNSFLFVLSISRGCISPLDWHTVRLDDLGFFAGEFLLLSLKVIVVQVVDGDRASVSLLVLDEKLPCEVGL